MLDLKRIRNNIEEIKKALNDRGENFDISVIDEVVALDKRRRDILVEVEELKNKRNTQSSQIPKLKKEGLPVDNIMAEMKELADKIKNFDLELSETDERIKYIMLRIPNIPNPEVPSGNTDEDNVEVRKFGEPRKFEFEPKEHWTLGTEKGILDFEAGGKVTGSRFTVYKGLGARLERAIINFFLNKHIDENGYTEILPPFMVNRNSMTGTGQLPKFEEDAFKVSDTDYFLIPTAEVPVTNLFRDEIIEGDKLPIKYAAYSACFRSEAGSAGRDTRGLVRQHQFNKVELVKFVKPEDSYKELESLVNDAESVLKALGLPYRLVKICKGDLGFTAAFKYDLEVWMPSYNRYVEISSCSNFEDFQARRANIKYKDDAKSKPNFVHTLNGSGVAIGRTVAAILENYQNADGTITIPEVLRPYMGGREVM
ncbi:serine--tRNA ligase [Clostridium argentinense CDC 2741]|uniref:Serine--tRNA ligase n=1 Tax=Clostridium argentinense CDC 2741 TaxID=1418104 RepID=A0A0C1U9Q6_9CLOT|nr:serine--tRNA ligase [Clostridium argentinense]ARC83301.1 serine--tRNA ligase [Clostridium argentinense]KIE48393.1 serine--tRNA ligase [Clostridium argentinense CDC 2741]NFF41469.1 serine--tRNA ligase [Clostridium argentinense]NFP52131.1 serine--tRNA ligase [Clostridium argentinense]NFP74508.1 serine--tRNA ligase [Clostridium argentinense]